MKYSSGLKARMIQRMSGPGSISATRLSREVGISQNTLSRWLRETATEGELKRNGHVLREHAMRPNNLPPLEKLRLVMEASTLPEEELGQFLRRNGLHGAQLEQWREAALNALAPGKAASRRKSAEGKRVKQLEQELDRKDKALAEVTALLALKKKLHTLLGDGDESTPPRRGR